MERLLLAVVLVAAAAVVAGLIRRRSTPAAPTRTGTAVPVQLDRADFERPEAPWLVVEFSSRTCLSCADTWEKVQVLACDDVAVHDIAYQDRKDLHERYAIASVPLVLVADAEGVVQASFLGPPSAADLWSTLADLRT